MDERLGDEELVWLLSETLGLMEGVTVADIDPEKLAPAAAAAAAFCRFSSDAAVLWIDSPDTSDIFSVVLSLKKCMRFLYEKDSSARLEETEKGTLSARGVCSAVLP